MKHSAQQLEDAKDFVRRCLVGIWKQKTTEEQITEVAKKVLKAIPPTDTV